MIKELEIYRKEVQDELTNILSYWVCHTVDTQNGGFAGRIDNENNIDLMAPKGSVLNSRILWTFSAAYQITRSSQHLQMAERAFKYLVNYFVDKEYGGIYWTVDYRGNPLDMKKQVYALSFAIYGLSEYYLAGKDEPAKKLAIALYKSVVEHGCDKEYGGYIEALSRDWSAMEDTRLSDKDANERKSMNTHLHVLEGFANLYRIWPDDGLKQRISELIHIFLDHIIDAKTHHLLLFFDDRWTVNGRIQSFGHDIEAAWLIQEAAEVIGDRELIKKIEDISVKIADAADEGLDKDGGLWYEFDPASDHLSKEKHWWPQAEAMVGYFNAWQITDDSKYLERSINSWDFIKKYILDKNKGEWFWGIGENYSVMGGEDKVGIWKCPYHNGRACMEIIKRIGA
ncbi:MAG: AGE family epimerase/isomerase [Chitinophagaceae bacterium]